MAIPHGVPFVDPCVMVITRAAIDLVPAETARAHDVVPISLAGEWLTVAVTDPFDFELLDKLRFLCGMPIEVVVADVDRIRAAVRWYYGAGAGV